MRYLVLWLGAVAAIVLTAMAVAGVYWLWTQLWWLPFVIGLALALATVVVAVEWLQDHPRIPRGPEDIDIG